MGIDEDFERIRELDMMYYTEHEMEIEEQWREWEEYQNRLPAKIEIISKLKEHEKTKNYNTSLE